jgi:hypothetical protein
LRTSISPYINRFIQPDSLIPDLSNPKAFNRYSYVKNSPVNFNDPTGHIDCPVGNTCGLAENLLTMLALALFSRVDSIVLSGNAINMIKKDPDFREFQGQIIMEKVYKDPRLYKEGFDFSTDDFAVEDRQRQLGGDRGPSDMLAQLINPNSSENSATWAAARNPLTWMLRTANISATGHVTKEGDVTINYQLTDRFDLRPDWERRSLAYNIATTILGGVWHDQMGASEPEVRANWRTVIKPITIRKPVNNNKGGQIMY